LSDELRVAVGDIGDVGWVALVGCELIEDLAVVGEAAYGR
jgi:hypothetical protein